MVARRVRASRERSHAEHGNENKPDGSQTKSLSPDFVTRAGHGCNGQPKIGCPHYIGNFWCGKRHPLYVELFHGIFTIVPEIVSWPRNVTVKISHFKDDALVQKGKRQKHALFAQRSQAMS